MNSKCANLVLAAGTVMWCLGIVWQGAWAETPEVVGSAFLSLLLAGAVAIIAPCLAEVEARSVTLVMVLAGGIAMVVSWAASYDELWSVAVKAAAFLAICGGMLLGIGLGFRLKPASDANEG